MKTAIIVAGGTGGHINAALSLGEELSSNDYHIIYFTGKRHLDYKLFGEQNALHIDARPLRTKNPLKLFINVILNIKTFLSLFVRIQFLNPSFVIGCGGYVCGPTLLASWLGFKKIYVVEQNAIAGMTNKLLAKISDTNFISFEHTKGISRNKFLSGNPIRSKIKYNEIEKPESQINILVFGGSLGATQINDAIRLLLNKIDKNIVIKHQVGKGNKGNINKENYNEYEYLDNIEDDYQWANIIISRSGASTVSELEMVQKPSILIPYPAAVDNHQEFNAKALKEKVNFHVSIVNQKLNNDELAQEISREIDEIVKTSKFQPTKVNIPNNATKIIIEEIDKQCMG